MNIADYSNKVSPNPKTSADGHWYMGGDTHPQDLALFVWIDAPEHVPDGRILRAADLLQHAHAQFPKRYWLEKSLH